MSTFDQTELRIISSCSKLMEQHMKPFLETSGNSSRNLEDDLQLVDEETKPRQSCDYGVNTDPLNTCGTSFSHMLSLNSKSLNSLSFSSGSQFYSTKNESENIYFESSSGPNDYDNENNKKFNNYDVIKTFGCRFGLNIPRTNFLDTTNLNYSSTV